MKIVLLSGGSGKRLWPLSNGVRSKQFLKLFENPDASRESMVQRVVRQISERNLDAEIVVATSEMQEDSILAQLGDNVEIVTEPERRDTFPAIALACAFLSKEKQISGEEIIVVMPSDAFTESGYFDIITEMCKMIQHEESELVLMGIRPTKPSSKFGYIIPDRLNPNIVSHFVEKPDVENAALLISRGALWNGGVFAFKLKYLDKILNRFIKATTFKEVRDNYAKLPKLSFDYEVVEKAESIGVVVYEGKWKDLGTWDTIAEELPNKKIGKVIDSAKSNLIINELTIPIVCNGLKNVIIVASPDGILVSDQSSVEGIKPLVEKIENRPMYEDFRWGSCKIFDTQTFQDGCYTLANQLIIKPGCTTGYQYLYNEDIIFAVVDGVGEVEVDNCCQNINRGDTITLKKGQKYSIKAYTLLTIILIQIGNK